MFLVFFILKKKKCPAYITKYKSTCEKQIILLMIPNEEKEGWNHLAVTKLSTLLRIVTYGDFYCLNIKYGNKLKSHKKVCRNNDFFGIVIPSEMDNTLEFNPI